MVAGQGQSRPLMPVLTAIKGLKALTETNCTNICFFFGSAIHTIKLLIKSLPFCPGSNLCIEIFDVKSISQRSRRPTHHTLRKDSIKEPKSKAHPTSAVPVIIHYHISLETKGVITINRRNGHWGDWQLGYYIIYWVSSLEPFGKMRVAGFIEEKQEIC